MQYGCCLCVLIKVTLVYSISIDLVGVAALLTSRRGFDPEAGFPLNNNVLR